MNELRPSGSGGASRAAERVAPGECPLVESRGVRRTFRIGKRPVQVLSGVDLTVRRGELVAIRGASGAGKSTFLHLLGGLDRPDAGEIRFEGVELGSLGARELARLRNRRFGFVFQAYHLLPELDALENVCLPGRMARMPGARVEARARELLAAVGLADRWDHRPTELSGGEQQRVAIARAMINQPDLLLADEPTGNLDSHTGHEIIGLLDALRAQYRTTLIIATHDARVAAVAPRSIELVDGVVNDGAPSAPAPP